LGGVLFIDEAYSLGNSEGRDSFSKECIDTINQNLTEKKNQLLVIIAGYKDALDSCFFNYNEGLRRRFPFVYTIEKYTNEEMSQILQKMIKELGKDWEIIARQDILNSFFQKNISLFPNSAGDIETLVFAIKIEHARRVFYYESNSNLRKKITDLDIENAFKVYISNKEIKELNTKSESHLLMYM
jgi:SpoVK/Ycf46/Vps4 family AAA+-type ATPase